MEDQDDDDATEDMCDGIFSVCVCCACIKRLVCGCD